MQSALLIIDMLHDFIDKDGVLYVGDNGREIINPISRLISAEKNKGTIVIYLCDTHLQEDAEFEMFPTHSVQGTEGAEIIPELKPESDDYIVNKRRYSGFFGTDLDIILREKDVDNLILTGVCTNICVLYTAADARNLNYSVTVMKDCTTSFDLEAHNFALREIEGTLGGRIK